MKGPTLPADTITEVLDHVLDADPGRVALGAPAGSVSYAELDAAADAAAGAFRELGVRAGDRVAATLPNDLDIVVAFHGAMRLGAVWVGINRPLGPAEKERLLCAADPKVFLADPETAAAHGLKRRVLRVESADLQSGWNAAVAACTGARRLPPPDPDLPAAIAFTSGTTGDPKGIVHSQRNLLLPAASIVASRGYDQTLRKGDCLPLTILNLQVLTTLLTSAAGGCCLLTDRRDARGVAEWIARESVNVWNGVPALLYSMVHDPELDPLLLQSLRDAWTGGGPCPEDLFPVFHERFGVGLHQSYGLTEAPTVVTIEPLDARHVDQSSGVVLPHLEVVVRDNEGNALPSGETGEIAVRAARRGPWAGRYTPMLGFWREDRVERFDSGELRTGDIGSLDQAGNLTIRDRKKQLIIRGGANVYPAEVERVIERVRGVRASAVVGIPDPRLGQRVVAVVELDGESVIGPDDIVEYCRRELARYEVPEQIRVVDVLPRNAMGKVQRGPLADLFSQPPVS
jgi:long-chain acyl-CoA synthetase